MAYRRIPSYNWLRVFEFAARYQSFTRAAEQLSMSSAAVSQQIKSLEAHLKQPLFIRGAHWVSLTDEGKAFLPVVQQSLSSIETTAAALFGNPSQQPLSIQSSLLFSCSWLSARLNDFQDRHPSVHLQISTAETEAEFGSGGKDLQITFGMGPQPNREGERIFGEYLYPVAIRSIAQNIHDVKDLLDYRLIEISSHRNSWLQVLSQDSEIDLNDTDFCFADNTQLAINMAASGMGIALARAPASDQLCEFCNLLPCIDGFGFKSPQEYYLIYPSLAGLSEAASQFRQWLLDSVSAENYPV
jgi:LysR family glycine cleavage system transcriptional activator